MSANNATTWALAVFDSDLSSTQKLICLYLRTHMNDYRECAWPSVGRIAAKCSLKERAVYENLKAICEKGYLIRNGRGPSGTIRYAIHTPALDAPLHETQSTPAFNAPELNKELNNSYIKGFTRPTIEQVADYCRERGNQVDPEQWMAHYESNGWKVGRNAMKDWKAAIRTWEKNSFEKTNRNNEAPRKLSGAERTRRAREAQRLRERGDTN